MPNASARWATSRPIRPRPMTPSVLSASSTPSHFERSQRPSVRAVWAWGMLRACASNSAIVCSAADSTLDCGALTTMTPRSVAASTSTLSSPMPARPTTTRSVPASSTARETCVAERMIRAAAPGITSTSSSADRPIRTSTTWPTSRSRCSPPSAIFSVTRMRAIAASVAGPGEQPPDRCRGLVCGLSARYRLEVLDGDRVDALCGRQVEAEDLGVERQLTVERPADVGRLPEAVLLALERDVGDGHPLGPQGVDDHLGLVGWHDLVLQALQHDQRPLDVEVAAGRIGADEPVEVAALELERLGGQRLEVGDAEVARTGGERVAERQRRQGGVATGRATPDAQPVGVDPPLVGQPAGGGDAVVEVDDTPGAPQLLAVVAAVAGRTAVVDVDHGEAAAGPVLRAELQHRPGRRGGPAVDEHEQRRTPVVGHRLGHVRVGGWVVQRVRGTRTARG